MDTPSWKYNTLSGGGSDEYRDASNMIEKNDSEPTVCVRSIATWTKALTKVSDTKLLVCYVSKKNREEPWSLANIPTLDSLQKKTNNFASNIYLV